MSIKEIRGFKIAYDETGKGTPLVLIHGHPFDRTMWKDQISVFESEYRVIVPDLRGYGESEVSQDKVMFEEFARDIAALLEELGAEKVVLCGLSMGGQIAFEFYRLFPEKILALILTSTFAQLDDPERKQGRYEAADRILREGMDEYAKEILPKMVAPKTVQQQPETAEYVLSMMKRTPPQGAAAALRARAERIDYTPLLAKIEVPTLIVVGSLDEFTPVTDAEFMRARIPSAKMVVIEGVGHLPNMENSGEFNRIINEFISTLD